MVGHHAGNLPRLHLREGLGKHLLVLVLCSQPTGTLALDQLPCRPGGEAAPQPVRLRWGGPALVSTLARATHGQPQHHLFPSGPMRAVDRAARGLRRHIEPMRPTGTARRTEPQIQRGADSALQSRGHRRPVRPDTWIAPDAWDTGRMDTGRPRDRLDGRPHGGQRTRTGDDRRGRRPDILATGDHPLGGQTSPGLQRLGALGHP